MTTNGQSKTFEVRILRQDAPNEPSRWERHRVEYEADMNVISVLQKVAANAITTDGRQVAPVAWESNCLEEVCGACTMLINGKARQACSALVDQLLVDNPAEIEIRPMSRFPVQRDLVVDRLRMFDSLKRVEAWVQVDDYGDRGAGPKQSQEQQEDAYPLTECMTCGCCLEACPQFLKIETAVGATLEEKTDAYSHGFLGAQAISQAVLFNSHPVGKYIAGERLDAIAGEGGIQVCGNAQNCVAVCPKEIPLTTSIARAGRATTLHTIKKWFDR